MFASTAVASVLERAVGTSATFPGVVEGVAKALASTTFALALAFTTFAALAAFAAFATSFSFALTLAATAFAFTFAFAPPLFGIAQVLEVEGPL